MIKNKVYTVAIGTVAVVATISICLLNIDKTNLNNSEEKNTMVSLKSGNNEVRSCFAFSQNKKLQLLFKDKDFNNLYIKNQSQKTEEAETQNVEIVPDIVNFIEKNNEEKVYNIITGKDNTNNREYLVAVKDSIDASVVSSRNVQLPVSNLYQNPELPTGCEVTSLTTVLNYIGYNVSKMTMAEEYLPKCDLGYGSFWDYFLGDPTNEYSFGCYASPIVLAANSYLKQQGNKYTAYNYSESGFETFLKEIEAGNPIILWSTMYLQEAFTTVGWSIGDEYVEWIAPEHCVVMTGYDLDANTVTISDPMQGIVYWNMDTVNLRYRQMCSQAVVIKANSIEQETKPIEIETDATKEAATDAIKETTTDLTKETTADVTKEAATDVTKIANASK